MAKAEYRFIVVCPWCERGWTLVNRKSDSQISCRCHKCGEYYEINLLDMVAERSAPKPKLSLIAK